MTECKIYENDFRERTAEIREKGCKEERTDLNS